jgi:serine/threonine-protein kinase
VVGETQAVATQTLHNDNLTVGTVTHHENGATSGTVLSTNPAAGASVGKNSAVNLVVSSGPNIPTVEVPSVTGLQLAPAIQRLTAANLSYTVKYAESNQPSGIVLSQDPAGGSHIKANIPVALTVVGTQTSVSVPSVLGQSQTNAGAILTRAGLNIGSQTSACSSQFPSGSVASQDPGGGANVPPNTPVNIVISTGACATVPSVVNQSQSAAQSALTHAGLVPSTASGGTCATGVPNGNVVSQNPTAGTQVGPGTTVTIAVCQSAPPPTTAPTTTSTTSTTTTTGANQTGNTGGRIARGGNHTPGG